MVRPSEKGVRLYEKSIRPSAKVAHSNEVAHKTSLVGSKRNYVPPQLLARGRGQRLADMYSAKRQVMSNSFNATRTHNDVLKSLQGQKNHSRGIPNKDKSNVNVRTCFNPLSSPPHQLSRNDVEDYNSSSESMQEDIDDNEIYSSPEDEYMHIPHDNEDLSDHDFEANENMIDHHNDNDNEREISTDIQEIANDGGASSTTKKAMIGKKRGRNKCKEIAKLKPNEKLEIEFYNNRAVGTNHKVFARHLGIIVRDSNIFPVRVRKWSDTRDREKEHMWTAVTDVFTNESIDAYKEHVLNHMRELWTNWRSDLLRYNVTKKKITLRAAYKGKPPNEVEENDWKWLIKEVYLDDDFQKISTRNSHNRAHYPKKLMHRTVSKPTRQVIWDELGANKGNKPSLVDVFHATRKKGTNFPNAEAKQKYDEIRKTIVNEPSLSHARVVQKVFKSKSCDRVVCFGGGITLKEITGPQPSRVEFQTELTTAKKQNQDLINRVDTVQAENDELKGRMGAFEAELKAFKDFMMQQQQYVAATYCQ